MDFYMCSQFNSSVFHSKWRTERNVEQWESKGSTAVFMIEVELCYWYNSDCSAVVFVHPPAKAMRLYFELGSFIFGFSLLMMACQIEIFTPQLNIHRIIQSPLLPGHGEWVTIIQIRWMKESVRIGNRAQLPHAIHWLLASGSTIIWVHWIFHSGAHSVRTKASADLSISHWERGLQLSIRCNFGLFGQYKLSHKTYTHIMGILQVARWVSLSILCRLMVVRFVVRPSTGSLFAWWDTGSASFVFNSRRRVNQGYL